MDPPVKQTGQQGGLMRPKNSGMQIIYPLPSTKRSLAPQGLFLHA
jgi:hypothetical protein